MLLSHMLLLYRIQIKNFLYILLDCLIIIISYISSYLIIFYPNINSNSYYINIKYIIILLISYLVPFYFFQIYRIIWNYSNIEDIYRLLISSIIGFFLSSSLILFSGIEYSRMILILSFLFTSGTLVLYRVIIRDYSTKSKKRPEIDNNSLAKLCKNNLNNKKDERILIVGAGETGRTILTEYCKKGMRKNVIGFVDDNEHKIGNFIIGKKIFNSIININYVIEQNFINKVIIAMPSADSSVINRVVTLIRIGNPNFPIKITPHFIDIFENRPLIPTLQEVGIVDLIG